MVTIEFDIPKGLFNLDKQLIQALNRAGGDALRAMRADSKRKVRDRKRFKATSVHKGLPVFFPRNKTELVWRMDVSGVPMPVSAFPHRQTRRGVSVAINKGKRSLIGGAFVVTMRSGHRGVFQRRGDKRLPIDEAFTTRIVDVFKDTGMLSAVVNRATSVFNATFERNWLSTKPTAELPQLTR